jgi:7-cyano-7-deazaguanine synthase in queuosine biosynthesis
MNFCGVEFDLPSSPAGILASGGADSSLVLYLLMKYSDQPLHIFTLSNKQKNFTNSILISSIVNYCIKKTGTNNIQLHTTFAEVHTAKNLYHTPFTYLKNNLINKLYIGDTCWPPDEINASFVNEYDTFQNKQDRSPHVIRPTTWKQFYLPFTNHNKKKIAEIYQEENIMDLFTLTRSCESLDNIGNEHCGKCWWCQERAWAFDLTTG